MTNQKTGQTQSFKGFWTEKEIDLLGVILTQAYKGQTTYTDPLELDSRIKFWKFILEEDYSMDQVLYGIRMFCKKKRIMPAPADVTEMLNPEKPKITHSAYIAALDWQKRNNRYDQYTDAYEVVKRYEKQGKAEQESPAQLNSPNVQFRLKRPEGSSDLKKLSDFGGDFAAYKKYLNDTGE